MRSGEELNRGETERSALEQAFQSLNPNASAGQAKEQGGGRLGSPLKAVAMRFGSKRKEFSS